MCSMGSEFFMGEMSGFSARREIYIYIGLYIRGRLSGVWKRLVCGLVHIFFRIRVGLKIEGLN